MANKKPLALIIMDGWGDNPVKEFNAVKAAKKLRGSQRDFVLRSLNQLKKDGSMNVEGKNLLLFGL